MKHSGIDLAGDQRWHIRGRDRDESHFLGLDACFFRDRAGTQSAPPTASVEPAAYDVADHVDAAFERGDLNVKTFVGKEPLLLRHPWPDMNQIGRSRGHSQTQLGWACCEAQGRG